MPETGDRHPDAVPFSEVREKFSEITRRVHLGGERIAMQSHGKTIAVPVPPSDLDTLEVLEERLDALDALADYRANGGVDFEDLKADLDL